ncbi:MAG TPA: multiheme c-type cytochrome [Dissulfurispiraceae bacterium]
MLKHSAVHEAVNGFPLPPWGLPLRAGQREKPKDMRLNSVWALLLGPILGMLYVTVLPLIFLFFVVMVLPGMVLAKTETAELPGEAQVCMGCHASQGMTKKFKNNEEISITVDGKRFAASVHGGLTCDSCHQGISMASHPAGREFKSREDFTVQTSKACKMCHSDEALMKKRMHYHAVTQAKAPPCVECHGAHDIKRIAQWKPSLNDNQYCLTCHKRSLDFVKNGEKVSYTVNEAQLKKSVHTNHRCPDCHREFSKEKHPIGNYANRRIQSITFTEACRKCHSDKFKLVEGSIHSAMLKSGNLAAPVCTDCHGFHSVSPKTTYETLSGVPCKKCHQDVFALYSESVHGKAKLSGHSRAPICSSCHHAHDVKVTELTGKIRDACLGCHKNAPGLHEKWLPNAALHLENISCAVCHSPDASRGISLRLVNKDTGELFTEEQVKKLLGDKYKGLFGKAAPHGGIDDSDLWNIVQQLNAKGMEAKVTFFGKMDVSTGKEAHQLTFKQKAIKECEKCHSADSDFFKNVTVAIIKADGKAVRLNAKQEVLGSLFSVLPVSQFYALGSTRLKLLDFAGLLMVMGGAAVPLVHLTIRKLTAPIRRRRKEGHK